MTVELTQEQVIVRIEGLPEETQKKMVCAMIGHSRIKEVSWGYWYCARCGEQVGDSIGSCYQGENDVIVGHDCNVCRGNLATLTWKDTFMAPDPFAKKDNSDVT
jgi:ribosomal protein L37AE/L43A